MITIKYLENIYNNSKVTAMPYEDKYMCMLAELPNGTIIQVGEYINGDLKKAIDTCKSMILDKIQEYEKYVQADKDVYGYDLDNEYTMEYGSGGELHG